MAKDPVVALQSLKVILVNFIIRGVLVVLHLFLCLGHFKDGLNVLLSLIRVSVVVGLLRFGGWIIRWKGLTLVVCNIVLIFL